ncbi:MAG TPA: hypothetical protein PLS30_06715 [Flavobacteriales bacterium]|jgi:hypothetical protein|nr:hypothetical protein [Flavobacteriales bacterium]
MQVTEDPLRWTFKWLIRLSLLTLISPFIWLEVDPSCCAIGRGNVPDVWIQGGYIHGKYILWPGILYAWIAQCVGILLFCGFVVGARCARRKPFLMKAILSPALLLLTLFPIWMYFYVDGVLGNSDGVCFTKHLSVGWGIYVGIYYLVSRIMATDEEPLDAR